MNPGRVPLAATGPILLTGASGYVGGRLLAALERDGHRVRCLARRPEMLPTRADSGTQVVAGDVLDRKSLDAALEGIETAVTAEAAVSLGIRYGQGYYFARPAAASTFAV